MHPPPPDQPSSAPLPPPVMESSQGGSVPPPHASGVPAWSRLHLWQIQPVRDLLFLLAIVGVIWLGYRLSIVTVPILLALLLAYLFEPLVGWATRRKLVGRSFAALSIIVTSTLLVVVPAVLGLTFGLAQGSSFVQTQSTNVQRLLKAVDQPDNAALRDALPSDRWRGLADWLIEQEAKAAVVAAVEGAKRGVRVLPEAGAESTRRDAADAPDSLSQPTTPSTEQGDSGVRVPVASGSGSGEIVTGENATGGDVVSAVTEEDNTPFDIVASSVAQVATQGVEWLRRHAGDIGAGAVRVGAGALGTLGRVAGSFATLVFGGFLTLFFFYFFCVSWDRVLCFFQEMVPDNKKERVVSLASRMDRVIAGFVRGRLTICLCQMVFFTFAYLIVGVPAAFVIGPIVGLLTIVPYAAALGMPVAMLLMALSPTLHGDFRDAWWWVVGAPIVIQGISQVMDDYFLTPKIQGKNTDMSMPMILFASIAGGVLGGVYGLLLAIPVAACAKIVLEEVVMPRLKAWTAGKVADPLPIER